MKKILVPIDFSKHSYYAMEAAASIAKNMQAELYVLHILNLPHHDSGQADTPASLYIMKLTHKKMKEAMGQPFLEGLEVKEEIIYEQDINSITEKAKELEIDMIVMGTHGASGVREMFIGSNTEKVVRSASMPVLAVKKRMEHFEPKNIVFASNFYGEVDSIFHKVREFAERFGATIHLLKVVTPNLFERTPYSERLLKDFAKQFDLKAYTINVFNDEHVEDGIIDFSRIAKADMIALGTHGRTGLARILNGSIAEDITNHAPLPVMSIRVKEPERPRGMLFPETK